MLTIPNIKAPDIIPAALFCLEFIKHHMLIDGKLENILIIFDLVDLNVFNAPYAMIKTLLQTLTALYKCWARGLFGLNTPKTFTVFWNVIYYIINEVSRAKLNIVSKNTCKQLTDLVAPWQLQERYGGTGENITENFWPPKIPSDNFGNEEYGDNEF